ncbi:MAG TPA: tetratricopeptide repeat protein [Thermoanaerobaculia bacterium]|jgi:tetratricopeptide (TPR) repeat protein|nr:tetratricopeptide repeat protein [Thermoanaerobaculia bacterium]
MATYPGNASLSSAVKDRVLSTFQQTLALYKQGRSAEVVEGCTLILRMDPMFDPAKKLLEKTRNPNSPVDVDSLMPSTEDPLREARTAMAARDFQRANDLTSEVLRDDFMNEEARAINDTAREKLEAAPFVEQFIRKAELFAGQGNVAAARSELEKARALDDGHPAISRVTESLSAPQPAASFTSGPSPSFVVDAPPPAAPAPGRKATQATDFGFTFEEDKPAANETFGTFSFDAPSPSPTAPSFGGFSFDAPPTPSGGGFDFTPASAPPGGDDQRKINQYLADGDRAASAGNYQQAIDLWSRIFLIDVTNDEASTRIENAKTKRRENEAKAEALVAAGEKSFNARDQKAARDAFNEALRLDPGNVAASEFLERMAAAAPAPFEMPLAPPPGRERTPAPPHGDIFDDDALLSGSYDSLKPPDAPPPLAIPAPKAARTKAAAVPAASKRSPITGVLLTIAAVVIVAMAGWFLWSKYMAKPDYDPSATQAVFVQANSLAKHQRYDQAIAILGDVKPSDPQHDKALEMIADLQHKKAEAAQMVNGRPASVVYDESIAAARAAFDGHDYEAAKTALDTASSIKPLPADLAAMYTTVSQQVTKLEVAKSLFKERRFQDAVTNLDPLLQADPQNQSIRRMLIAAHFDLGAAALQEERLPDAMREFAEVLKTDPNDELAKRSRALAERYTGQPKDLLYKIYVKYLPVR